MEERGEHSVGIDHNRDKFNGTELTGFLCSLLEMSNTHTQASQCLYNPPTNTRTHAHSVRSATGSCVNDPKMIFLHTVSPLGVRESARSELSNNGIQSLPFMA